MEERICDALRKRREEMGLSVEEISLRLGINKDTYKNWESDKTIPKPRFFKRIKNVMGIDVKEFAPPTLYMAVTLDEIALPLAVADTPEELAKMMGVKVQTIFSCICNSKKHKHSKYLKVVLDDDIH